MVIILIDTFLIYIYTTRYVHQIEELYRYVSYCAYHFAYYPRECTAGNAIHFFPKSDLHASLCV